MATINGITAEHMFELMAGVDTRLTSLEASINKIWYEPIRFLVGGAVDASTVFPPAYIPKATSQVITVRKITAKLLTGTSIDVQVRHNGANLGTLINNLTSARATQTLAQVCADGDEIDVVLSDPQGTPSNLEVTVILEHTI